MRIIYFIIFLFGYTNSYSQATFTSGSTAAALATQITGPGITITNPVITTGDGTQRGIFSNGIAGASLQLDSGIILTTSSVTEAFSTNSSGSISINAPGPVTYSDTELVGIEPQATRDVILFEFDATLGPLASVLTIDYQFMSDEYNEYVCSGFNDTFGYFITSDTTAPYTGYTNIALVPGTANTVAIGSINNGVSTGGGICADLTQAALFIDNTGGGVTMEFDGMTKKLRASATGLVPGQTYHVKLAIADSGDSSWDSAVLVNLISGFADHDNDGITDDIDVDDDNDGILDTEEDANTDGDNNPLTNPTDTDGDGVFNYFDLDSDDDGIPDNIEAQNTNSYISPNNVYNGIGEDTAYLGGLTPVNTDGSSDGADYLDTDADNDGNNDTTEAGLTLTGNGGTNGLDNGLESSDDYSDVNGNLNDPTTLPDADGDVGTGGDVDYRDTLALGDNDDDGVLDTVDLDDDNDGILDTQELCNANTFSCLPSDPNADDDLDNISNYADPDYVTGFVGDIIVNGVWSSLDFDGDGIINSMDLDADGDGIPDNIEGQTTNTYISPNNIVGGTGIDTAYGAGLVGMPNTDAIDEADYKDTDADDEGSNDTLEAGLTLDGIIGTNGLDSAIYTTTNYSDVNGIINDPTTLPDSDSDLGTGGDVDYRDDTVDITLGSGNLLLWLRADIDATTALWQDQSGNNQDATSTVAPTKNDNGVNFNPTFQFNGSSQFMEITNGILGVASYNNLWVYIVSNTHIIQNSSLFRENITGGERLGTHLPWSDSNIYFDFGQVNTATGRVNAPWGSTTNTFNLWNYGYSNATTNPSGANKSLYRDGLRFATGAGFDATIQGNNQNFFIGSSSGSSDYHDGEIAEIIIFADIPSSLEQQKIQSYLALKYGITLDISDNDAGVVEGDYILSNEVTKVWDFTANSTYHNDVAGIGRDDTQVLNQKQSKSINSDAIITIGLGSIASNNATNANSFATDKDFLVWGNDNTAMGATSTSGVLCATNLQLDRKWKIVETGSVSTVQIAATKSEIDTYLNNASFSKVIKVADDEALTTNVEFLTLTTATIDGVLSYVSDFDFNGTKFFTFAEVSGITWTGSTSSWSGGAGPSAAPSTLLADNTQLMTIDAEGTTNHATLIANAQVGCVWVKSGSKLMIATNLFLQIQDQLQLDGELKLTGTSQLIQAHAGASQVTGSGKLYIDQTGTVTTKYRYNYWTSPVTEIGSATFTVGGVMKDGTIPTSEASSSLDINFISYDGSNYNTYNGDYTTTPITIANYWIYSYVNGLTGTSWIQEKETGHFNPGEAYIMKGPGAVQNYTFVGTPNDGDITSIINGGYSSLLGNPYPSALDANQFFTDNSAAINSLYFWEHLGDGGDHTLGSYIGGYGVRSAVTGVAATTPVDGTGGLGGLTYTAPGQYIPVAQGFFVESTVAGGTITFNNNQRLYQAINGTSSVFFKGNKTSKATTTTPVLKIGFEYTDDDNLELHRQIAISFKSGHSYKKDNGYDSTIIDINTTDIFFKFPEGRDSFVIAGIQEITDDLEFPLAVNIGNTNTVKFMIDTKENINQYVILTDKITGQQYDITTQAAELTLTTGTYLDRFYISFSQTALNTLDNELNKSLYVFFNNTSQEINIKKLHSIDIKNIELYTLLGRKIEQWDIVNNSLQNLKLKTSLTSTGVYIIKLKTNKGIISKKIVCNN